MFNLFLRGRRIRIALVYAMLDVMNYGIMCPSVPSSNLGYVFRPSPMFNLFPSMRRFMLTFQVP